MRMQEVGRIIYILRSKFLKDSLWISSQYFACSLLVAQVAELSRTAISKADMWMIDI